MQAVQSSGPQVLVILMAATVPGLLAAVFAWFAYTKSLSNSRAIQGVHNEINSRLDELIRVSNALARKEGIEQGRNEPRDK